MAYTRYSMVSKKKQISDKACSALCSTIIVSYNTFDLTKAAIETALASGAYLGHEVVVIDNKSPDQSGERLQACFPAEQFPNVKIICSEENLGFTKGNNEAVRHATGEILFFLNADTVVLGDAIPKLVNCLQEHPSFGAIGPRVLNADGSDQVCVLPFITASYLLHFYFPVWDWLKGQDQRSDPSPLQSQPVDIIKGCSLMVRRAVFEQIGGWDESYFMYAEETEMCYAIARAGYTNYFLREAEIIHYGGASSLDRYPVQQIAERRSALKFLKRHHGWGMVWLNRIGGILGFGLRSLIFKGLMRRNPAKTDQYRMRQAAAAKLWRWFLFEYK